MLRGKRVVGRRERSTACRPPAASSGCCRPAAGRRWRRPGQRQHPRHRHARRGLPRARRRIHRRLDASQGRACRCAPRRRRRSSRTPAAGGVRLYLRRSASASCAACARRSATRRQGDVEREGRQRAGGRHDPRRPVPERLGAGRYEVRFRGRADGSKRSRTWTTDLVLGARGGPGAPPVDQAAGLSEQRVVVDWSGGQPRRAATPPASSPRASATARSSAASSSSTSASTPTRSAASSR